MHSTHKNKQNERLTGRFEVSATSRARRPERDDPSTTTRAAAHLGKLLEPDDEQPLRLFVVDRVGVIVRHAVLQHRPEVILKSNDCFIYSIDEA